MLPAACRLFSRGVIFTRAQVSLALLSLRKNGGLLVAYSTLGARDFSSAVSGFCQVFLVVSPPVASAYAEDVSAFGQHRKFPPHARKTSGTQGK